MALASGRGGPRSKGKRIRAGQPHGRLRRDPLFFLELQAGTGTGLGGTQLTLPALTGELDSQASFFFFNGDQANSKALKISPLAKNLGLGGEGKASGE